MDTKILAAVASGALGLSAGALLNGGDETTVVYQPAPKTVSGPDRVGVTAAAPNSYVELGRVELAPGAETTSGVNLTAGARIAAPEVEGASLVSSQCLDFADRTWCEVTVRNTGTGPVLFRATARIEVP